MEKDTAYCFYCFFNERIDEKFGHDVFNKIGFDRWKNVVDAFCKHAGGPCIIHNISREARDDFKNQKTNVKKQSYNFTMMHL